jgi:LysM repeat protein
MIRRVPYYILFSIFQLAALWVVTQTLSAQEVPYTVHRSEDKIILEGKVYYIHIVKEKETLYGISRAYNVSQKGIAAENPDVFAGLQVGMVLKIPSEPVLDESAETRETDEYFNHVVQEGETLYFLSKKYGIDVLEIERANPEISITELPVGQALKIPKRKEPSPAQNLFTADSFIYHYVKAGETLYSLSVYYDISIEEIKEINPELRWGELQYDEYIKIPRPADTLTEVADLPADYMLVDTMLRDIDTLGIPFWSEVKWRRVRPEPIRGTIRVAMLLPLDLYWDVETDTLDLLEMDDEGVLRKDDDDRKDMINPRIIGYLEFYEGALLAINELSEKGYSITMNVFDTERSRQRTREILRKWEMEEMDLIIGPVNFWNLEIVADFARQHEIPMVSPFSSDREIVRYNPYIFQVTPSYDVEFKSWAEYISDYYDKTIIVFHDGDSTEYHKVQFLKDEIFKKIAEKADLEDLIFKEVVMNDSVFVDMNHVLTQDGENLVVVPSDNEAYVSNVISPLFYLLDQYQIEVAGMPQWNKFRNIDLEYFHKLKMSYFTSFYVDYDKPEMKEFIHRFREVYYTEPYRISPRGYNLSVYGYDLVSAFVSAIGDYGGHIIYFADEMESDPILGPYKFERINDFGGHVNAYISIIKFSPDLNIQQVELESRPQRFWYRRYSRRYQND